MSSATHAPGRWAPADPQQPLTLLTACRYYSITPFLPKSVCCSPHPYCFLPLFCLRLTVAEVAAGGAVLLHQIALAVAIALASPGRTDK